MTDKLIANIKRHRKSADVLSQSEDYSGGLFLLLTSLEEAIKLRRITRGHSEAKKLVNHRDKFLEFTVIKNIVQAALKTDPEILLQIKLVPDEPKYRDILKNHTEFASRFLELAMNMPSLRKKLLYVDREKDEFAEFLDNPQIMKIFFGIFSGFVDRYFQNTLDIMVETKIVQTLPEL